MCPLGGPLGVQSSGLVLRMRASGGDICSGLIQLRTYDMESTGAQHKKGMLVVRIVSVVISCGIRVKML